MFAGSGALVAVLITLGLNFLGLNIPQSTVEDVINTVSSLDSRTAPKTNQPAEFKGNDSYEQFVQKVVGSTDDVWTRVFASNGLTYQKPQLILFRNSTTSGCGVATSAVGPHYCPNDSKIYLDETFFDQLKTNYGASTGDVAQAYVIAHEVGHHVQNQLGVFQANNAQDQTKSIEIELQADCYAGIWAYSQSNNNIFEPNEINEALSAASAVGDDNIQKSSGYAINPETWTHGSSVERVGAFNSGFTTGDPSKCTNLQS
jgi:predicted metalloprotease